MDMGEAITGSAVIGVHGRSDHTIYGDMVEAVNMVEAVIKGRV